MNLLAKLRQRKKALLDEAAQLNAKDTLTEAEESRLEELMGNDGDDSIARVNAKIERQEKIDDERRNSEAALDLDDATADRSGQAAVAAGSAGRTDDGPRFASLGEQLQAVAHAAQGHIPQSEWDPRLQSLYRPGKGYQAASGSNEGTPAEGGFLVQSDIGEPIVETLFSGGELSSRVRRYSISSNANGMSIPAVDETSRANGSRWGGVQGYWADEAATVTASKPTYREMELKLNKLFGLGYATDEMLQDSNILTQHFSRAFREELTFKVEDGIYNGTGTGKLLGLMNSSALVTIAKESGQAAQTIMTENVLKMWARLPMRSRRTAVWLCNQDIEPQLYPLTLGTGTAVTLLYTPPGVNGNNSPFGLLLGRPVIPVEYAATLGTAGDLVLADLDQYLTIDKGAVREDWSMHVRFLYDEQTFRILYRVDGQPMWKSPITPYKGAAAQSPFIALGAR